MDVRGSEVSMVYGNACPNRDEREPAQNPTD